jgi:hypothetical protein
MVRDSNVGLVDEYWNVSNVRHSERLLRFSLHNLLKYECTIQFGNLCLLIGPKSDISGPQEVFSRLLRDRAQHNDTGPVFNIVSLLVESVQIHLPKIKFTRLAVQSLLWKFKKKSLSQLTYSLFLNFRRPKTHKNVNVTKPDMFWILGLCTNP